MRSLLVPPVLGAVVLVSALGVVWSRHEARRLFTGLEQLERDARELEEEWGRLLLEHGTWADRDRIGRLARERLNMRLPDMKDDSWRMLEESSEPDLPVARGPGTSAAPGARP